MKNSPSLQLLFPLLAIIALAVAPELTSSMARASDIYASGYSAIAGRGIYKYDGAGTGTLLIAGYYRNLAFNNTGDLYAVSSDYPNSTIEKIDALGNSTHFVNLGPNYWVGDMDFDASGNLYIAKNYGEIIRFNSSGIGTTFANLGPDTIIKGMAFDSTGNLYVSFAQSGLEPGLYSFGIEKFDSQGTGTLFANTGLFLPSGLAFSSDGTLYAAGQSYATAKGNPEVDKFSSTGTETVFESDSVAGKAYDLLAFDSNGDLFVSDTDYKLYRFDSFGNKSEFATVALQGGGLAIPVPEPSAIILLGLGLAYLGLRKKVH